MIKSRILNRRSFSAILNIHYIVIIITFIFIYIYHTRTEHRIPKLKSVK